MNIFCLGVNHRTAPIDAREKLWFSEEEQRSLLPGLRLTGRIQEAVLVSTCNRTELYFVADEDPTLKSAIVGMLGDCKNSGSWIGEEHFYLLSGTHAVKHLLGLATGRDSMVLGDIQILNQIKTSYALAQGLQTTGTILNRLFTNAIHTGKRARTETDISGGAVSVGYAAAELALKIFQDLTGKTALLIGAGETGTLTAKHLHGQQLGKLFITNRTRARAEALTADLPGTVIDFENFITILPSVDIIISSITTATPVLDADQLRAVMQARRQRPLFIIDLGMPRNIDPAVRGVENVFLHDIDDLFHIVDRNLAGRQAEIPAVNSIVLHEVKQFVDWYRSLKITPTIQGLREQFEEIRRMEVERYLNRFPPDMREDVTLLTTRIVNKILHGPMVNLRNGSTNRKDDETQRALHLIRSLFDLDIA